jgi:hypothetical protein
MLSLLLGSLGFSAQAGKAPAYTFYASPFSVGEAVNCTALDFEGDFIKCMMAGAEQDRAFGIVVDGDFDYLLPYIQDLDGNIYVEPQENYQSYDYYANEFSLPTTIQCTPIDPQGDFVKCLMAGAEQDRAFGIVVDGDAVPSRHIQLGEKAFGILVD